MTPLEVVLEQSRQQQKELLALLASIKEIRLIKNSEHIPTEKLKASIARVYPQVKNGRYSLEVETISTSSSAKDPIILQYSIFDLRTRNKIAEFSVNIDSAWL